MRHANAPSVVFFDMDGVLCDFVTGACDAHGKYLPAAEARWDFMAQIGFTGGGDMAFWEPLSNQKFWANLAPLLDGIALLKWAIQAFGQEKIGILSSGLCPGSCDGKREWLSKHLPEFTKRAVFCTVKELCAAPCKILIDDNDANAEKFAAAGGKSILVPRPWNKRRGESCEITGRFSPERVSAEISAAL